MLKLVRRCYQLYGTVDYFSDCLTSSIMNRLVNEQASSLKDCYQQLLEEIDSSPEAQEVCLNYSKNLTKAYELVLNHFNEKDQDLETSVILQK